MKILQTDSSAKDLAYEGYLKINNCGLCTDATAGISVENRGGRKDYMFVYIKFVLVNIHRSGIYTNTYQPYSADLDNDTCPNYWNYDFFQVFRKSFAK